MALIIVTLPMSGRKKLITAGIVSAAVLASIAIGIEWVSRRLWTEINQDPVAEVTVVRTKGTPDNYVYNGDFEKGVAEWAGGGAALIAVEGGQSGQCLKLIGDGSPFQYAITWNVAQLNNGGTYELSFWEKSGDSGEQKYLGGVWDPKGSKWITFLDGQSTATWTRRSVRFTTTSRDPVSVELMRLMPGKGDVLFDSVQLRKAKVDDNLVVNGDFEAGTSGWDAGNASLSTVAGGQSGQALQIEALNGRFPICHPMEVRRPATGHTGRVDVLGQVGNVHK